MGGRGWQWFRRAWAEATIQAVMAVALAAVLPVVASYIPVVGTYVNQRLLVPVWLLSSLSLTALALAFLALVLQRRVRAATTPAAQLPERKRPKLTLYDLEWEVDREFLAFKDSVDIPHSSTLDTIIKGPFCPQCGRLLRGRALISLGTERAYLVENPCKKCGRKVENRNVIAGTLHALKGEIFREAQRLLRRGELLL